MHTRHAREIRDGINRVRYLYNRLGAYQTSLFLRDFEHYERDSPYGRALERTADRFGITTLATRHPLPRVPGRSDGDGRDVVVTEWKQR